MFRFILCAALFFALAAPSLFAQAAAPASQDYPTTFSNVAELYAADDPLRDPLEVEVLRDWDEDGIHFEQVYFTGQVLEGFKTRVYAYRAAPVAGKNLPGILHCHGGGGSASLEAVRFWAKRGYVCVSFDYSGDTNKNGLPQFRREHFTKWGEAIDRHQVPGADSELGFRDQRWGFWYNCTAAGRRAITFLQSHPSSDPSRIGVTGISAGGYLSWFVAGADSRVTTAVPVYGNAGGLFRDADGNFFTPEDPAAYEVAEFQTRPEIPEFYAPHIKCPILFLTATNDGFNFDHSFDTLDRLPQPSRQLFTPRFSHHMEPDEGIRVVRWMDWHLKGIGDPWPATPVIEAAPRNGLPSVTITPELPNKVTKFEVYYNINNAHPGSRFWRDAILPASEGGKYYASLPFFAPGDVLYVWASVTYGDGPKLSTKLLTIDTATLGVAPTLKAETLIDDMLDPGDWYWVPAYTEPIIFGSYFASWHGPSGERGFTLNPAFVAGAEGTNVYNFDIATQKIADPQWRGIGRQTLLLDYWGPSAPRELKLRAVEKWGRVGMLDYFFPADFSQAGPGWTTLELNAADFTEKETGANLADWSQVQFLDLLGVGDAAKPPVFSNLRWKE